MIALLLAAAVHLTPPEQFFCDDLHWRDLRECIHKTRAWICQSDALRDTDEPDALYVQTVRQERQLVCHRPLRRAAVFVQATHHQCRVPSAAWQEGELTLAELNAMEKFGQCLCGREGTVDWDPRPHRHGGYFMHPSCNRDGWDGHRYEDAGR